jgi:hypothetical protein
MREEGWLDGRVGDESEVLRMIAKFAAQAEPDVMLARRKKLDILVALALMLPKGTDVLDDAAALRFRKQFRTVSGVGLDDESFGL